ncbi:MAG: hypothetical protein FWE49_04690 [Synergistaceae bacterium]|nr:hypothetical protein [Synergistaceae bacterium]
MHNYNIISAKSNMPAVILGVVLVTVSVKIRLCEEHSDVAIHTIVKRKADIIFYTARMDCHTVCGRFAMTRDDSF